MRLYVREFSRQTSLPVQTSLINSFASQKCKHFFRSASLDSHETHRHFVRKHTSRSRSFFRFHVHTHSNRPPSRNGAESSGSSKLALRVRKGAARRGGRKKILNFRSKGNYARVKSPFMSLPSTPAFPA